jgi:phosphate transport system protein
MDADTPIVGEPLRHHFAAELDQIRLQLEVMAIRVADAIRGSREVLRCGDLDLAAEIIAADDEIDGMLVSLTERCYDVIRREAPVASDLLLIVSVIRILEELERIGDLSLRVVKASDDYEVLAAQPQVLSKLVEMAGVADELFGLALAAWSSRDAHSAAELAERDEVMDVHYKELTRLLLALEGADAVAVAMIAVVVGRALERIADHAVVIGERLGYLLTGDASYLASEIR